VHDRGVVAVLVLFVRYLADPLMAWLARPQELLVIGRPAIMDVATRRSTFVDRG
jgi:hypothetical protein